MKPFSPEEIQQLSFDFLVQPDDRPTLLKDLTALALPTERYCRFLYEFCRRYEPELVIETGTDRGRSAAHFALGNPKGKVVTIDIAPACKDNADSLKIENIISVAADSLEFAKKVKDEAADVLFLDSLHTYEHTKAEWLAYRFKVKPSGIVFFDDIMLDAGMSQFWAEVEGRRFDLSHLHSSGFGGWVPG
jgi:predicted O-methyltransferase YrrM